MVLPKIITIRGRKIQVPELNPTHLTPVNRSGRVVAYRTESNTSSFNSSFRPRLDWTGPMNRLENTGKYSVS